MAGKPASSAFRLPTVNSDYHKKCISQQVKVIQEGLQRSGVDGDQTHPPGSYRKCNQVSIEKNWKESVSTEKKLAKKWESKWSYLLEYDYEGRPKEKKKLPESISYFNSSIPTTSYGAIGSKVNSLEGIQMMKIEHSISHRKHRSGLESNYV